MVIIKKEPSKSKEVSPKANEDVILLEHLLMIWTPVFASRNDITLNDICIWNIWFVTKLNEITTELNIRELK